jgi:UDP-N-acetylmuramoyl-tripeptide--D-alanyl-D-alanine ligase
MDKIQQLYNVFLKSAGVSIDTRKEVKNTIFFALSGENFNGNRFAAEALEKGAVIAVIDDADYDEGEKFFLTDNVLETLQQLALFHRKKFKIPVIGITGTNGKTTTKELVKTVLEQKYHVTATTGNYNNHIGVPVTLLAINRKTEIAVVEMGASHIGEIALLCNLALPTHGLITNIGKAHLEGFGSFEGVKKTKRELYDFIENNKGTVIVNNDDPILRTFSKNINKFTYGVSDADVTGKIVKYLPFLSVEIITEAGSFAIDSKLYGSYNFYNIMAAAATGTLLGVPAEKIKTAIENYIPVNNRSQQIKTARNFVILDAYNANPVSLSYAINSFKDARFNDPLLIIGDMFELGNDSPLEHQEIVNLLIKTGFQEVILVGKHFFNTNHPFLAFAEKEEASDYIRKKDFTNRTVLIKGSNGLHLETLLKYL